MALAGCGALGAPRVGELPRAVQPPTPEELAEYPCRHGQLEACRARCENDATSCNAAGLLYELEGGTEAQVAAAALYRKGCDDAYAPACNNLAWLYALGRGVPRDPPRSLEVFARAYAGVRMACLRGEASGCVEVAAMLQEGRGVEVNEPLASLYLAAAGVPATAEPGSPPRAW